MKPHKWHKEIKAWADGADIEYRGQYPNETWNEWTIVKNPSWDDDHEGKQYRIKPQPKEPINLKCKSLQKRLATQWISVEDKLPEFVTINNYEKASNDILILIDNKHIYVGAYIFDVWSKTDDFCMRDLDGGYEVVDDMKITHWMPLPDAPKESNDD